jgi:hypothetical protein
MIKEYLNRGVSMKNQKGFTKTEVLIIIVLLGILGTIIWVAVDPFERLSQERDNIRRSESVAVLNSVLKYKTVNDGELPQGIDFDANSAQVLGTAGVGCDFTCGAIRTTASCVDLQSDLVDLYLEEIPSDPKFGDKENSDYYINRTTTGSIVVGACDPELSRTISVTR